MKYIVLSILCIWVVVSNAQTDILHYQINLNIQQIQQKQISGYTQITFIAEKETNSFSFDLLKLTVSEVKLKQNAIFFSQNDSVLFITTPSGTKKGDTITIQVFYSGQPVTDATWGGFYFANNYAYNMGVAFSSVPHNFGRCWFPCNDNFTDRATYDFFITTDSDFKAVCNGLLINETTNSNGSKTWHWKLGQPIPTYLANVAVGRYIFITDIYNGKERQIPILIAVEPKDSLNAAKSLINLKPAMLCFEEKFGSYAFDRIGYVAVPFSAGAMEHASNISYPIYALNGQLSYETLMAHELSHMWFGNMATCEKSSEMWLNEGWASFCEAEFLNCLYGIDAYNNDIKSKIFDTYRFAHARDGGFKSITGATNDITYGTHVYKKGALAAHNLKIIMGDSAFYKACKSYLQKFKFNHVNTLNLQNEFQKHTTRNLSNYFSNWIHHAGNFNVVFDKFIVKNNIVEFDLVQQKKYAPDFIQNTPVSVTLFNHKLQSRTFKYEVNADLKNIKIPVADNFIPVFGSINFNEGFALAKTTDLQILKGTGNRTFSETLITISIRNNKDSAVVLVEHHFTPPLQQDVADEKIRISPDRYWRIDGMWDDGFKASVFFNYDGSKPINKQSGYLDIDLFYHAKNEDSLVLLYRAFPTEKWIRHQDNTFQPGNSKTDLAGRFWVNNIQKGEYAFGVVDAKTSLNNQLKTIDKVSVFPNPTKSLLNISGIQEQHFLYEIYNSNGKEVLKGKSQNNIIDIGNINNGVYILIIKLNHQHHQLMFVKE